MYLSATTHKIQAVMSGAAATTNPQYVVSYQDITSTGMTIPQSSSQGSLNGTTPVDIVAAPSASTNRQVVHISIYNADTATVTVTVTKDVSGTDYTVVKYTIPVGGTLEWTRETGWQVLSANTGVATAFQTFTSNGTYTKPSGLKYALVTCVGAGGGGGSGRQGAAGENRFGGGGGGGGAIVWRLLSANDIAATVSVTVGTGGGGGAAQASTS